MLNQLREKKKQAEGFTIIEVMIVLVIAAVIILIVFLAVPALQRNSRNNQRKNDVSRISSAVTEYANNNNGTLPSDYGDITGIVGDLAFYEGTSVGFASGSAGSVSSDTVVEVVTGSVCGGTDNDEAVGGSGRQHVILYAVETGGATADSQCLEG